MKKSTIKQLALGILGMFLSISVFANKFKVPMDAALIPEHITTTFHAEHTDAEGHRWYPYPYYNVTSEKENQRYFSKLSHKDQNAFYEVEFKENDITYRKIFDEKGEILIWSEVVENLVLPQQIKTELSALSYFDWKVENYEKVYENNFETEIKHKVILSKDSKTRVIYFNKNEFVHKILKWEYQNYAYSKNKTVFMRSAYQGNRTEIVATELPDPIKEVIVEKEMIMDIKQILMVDAVHIPEHRIILDYYGVPLNPKYEITYKKGSNSFKAIFSTEGELLEENKVIRLKKVPKYVKEELSKQKYTFWHFSDQVDLVYLEDGSTCYRLHAEEFGISQILVLNSK